MAFDPIIAVTRFGLGMSPAQDLPRDADALLEEAAAPTPAETRHAIAPFATAAPSMTDHAEMQRARREAQGTARAAEVEAAFDVQRDLSREVAEGQVRATIARGIDAPYGFRERLVAFWADHFTVKARNGSYRHLVSPYIEEAIRPHIMGRFVDLLQAADTHPMMLLYLQQVDSVGPNSEVGLRRGRGLNENLAREMIELHTLGVGSAYSQSDVQEMAALLSGLTFTRTDGMHYDPRRAEPGPETVMGVSYGADAMPQVIERAMADLAAHPATAAHLAQKLAAHFVADTPDSDLVSAIAETFLATDGDLAACYATLLAHPAAWVPDKQKVRPPVDFIIGALRALEVPGAQVTALDRRETQRMLINPMRVMGQPWQRPTGPDGWADTAADWIIPQAMAGRITWAMWVPVKLRDPLPDPRDFVTAALGPAPEGAVAFAASAAETRIDGVGVILSSAAFNRR